MTKKIAIPIENGKLCAHFGHCEYFAIATVQNNQIIEIIEKIPPAHEPGIYPQWITSFNVTDVIAGGMGQEAIKLFNQQNINVFVGAPIKGEKEIVEKFLANELSLNANYCNHDENDHQNCSH
ncbi:MAG: NifB/NifX family molybdenum-iron cluster-binding protein [Dysgonamonadaceae bacterium]